MKRIEASDVMRLLGYSAAVCAAYLVMHALIDLLKSDWNPSAWFVVSANNLTTIGIWLMVAFFRWLRTMGEKAPT